MTPGQRRQHNAHRQRLSETGDAAALPLAMATEIAGYAVSKTKQQPPSHRARGAV